MFENDSFQATPAAPELGKLWRRRRAGSEWPERGMVSDELQSAGITEFLNAFRRRKGVLAGLVALGTFVGLAIAVLEPVVYPAATSLEILGVNESFMNLNQLDPQANPDSFGASESNILTQIRILRSSMVLRRVSERLERETIPNMPPRGSGLSALLNLARGLLQLTPGSPVLALQEAIETAAQSVDAKPVHGTRVVELKCESSNPEVAADFLNVLVNEFTESGLENRLKMTKRTNQWLEGQLQDQKKKLEESEARLTDFVKQSGVQGLTQEQSKGTLADAKLSALQQDLSSIQADRIAKQTRYDAVVKGGPEALPDVYAGSTLPQLQANLTDLRRQLAELNTTFTPAHPKVQRVQAQIASIAETINKEREQTVARLKNDAETARRREQLLQGTYAGQTAAMLSQSDKTLQYTFLRREVETNRQIYNGMLQQVNQAVIATAVPMQNVRVVEPAETPFKASLRHFYIAAGLGLMTGLLFGCVLAVLLQQADPRVYNPGQSEPVLNVPELGVIPADLTRSANGSAWKRIRTIPSTALRRSSNGAGSKISDVGLNGAAAELYEPAPPQLLEGFRCVLLSMLFAGDSGQHRVVAVTSPNSRDGKSTVALNLAVALAEMKRRVLLVDADLRKPKLHQKLNVLNTWGLTDILADHAAISSYPVEALSKATSIAGVYLLPSGPATRSITHLLSGPRLNELLERLGKEFDHVIIDTPPVLAVSDARLIGRAAKGTLLVLRSGQTSQGDALAVVHRLQSDGAFIAGTVLNDWKPSSRSRYREQERYYDSNTV